jgi:uncharacterized protein (DUF488 family)
MIQAPLVIHTIGHSTHPIEEFVEMLRSFGIERLIDVRTIPRSRHNPQFNHQELARSLHNRAISYRHLKSLGGLRHARKDSVNTGWHNSSFRGYADYMQTPEFEEGLAGLIALAREKVSAILCAEAVPWRCHRSLIADALVVRGIEVRHILGTGNARPHELTPFARVTGIAITYPADAAAV